MSIIAHRRGHCIRGRPTNVMPSYRLLPFLILVMSLVLHYVSTGEVPVLYANQGDDVTIPCNLGDQEQNLDWTKGPDYSTSERNLLAYKSGGIVGGSCVSTGRCDIIVNDLIIRDTIITDEGTYYCGGPKHHSSTQLLINVEPVGQYPIIDLCGQEQNCTFSFPVGYSLWLTCKVSGSRPAAELQWRNGSEQIYNQVFSDTFPNPDGTFDTVARMLIDKTTHSAFRCDANGESIPTNKVATATINITDKSVPDRPQTDIISPTEDSLVLPEEPYPTIDYCGKSQNCTIYFPIGYTILLTCRTSGSRPPVHLIWTNGSKELSSASEKVYNVSDKTSYTVSAIKVNHTAIYSVFHCRAEGASVFGRHIASIHITDKFVALAVATPDETPQLGAGEISAIAMGSTLTVVVVANVVRETLTRMPRRKIGTGNGSPGNQKKKKKRTDEKKEDPEESFHEEDELIGKDLEMENLDKPKDSHSEEPEVTDDVTEENNEEKSKDPVCTCPIHSKSLTNKESSGNNSGIKDADESASLENYSAPNNAARNIGKRDKDTSKPFNTQINELSKYKKAVPGEDSDVKNQAHHPIKENLNSKLLETNPKDGLKNVSSVTIHLETPQSALGSVSKDLKSKTSRMLKENPLHGMSSSFNKHKDWMTRIKQPLKDVESLTTSLKHDQLKSDSDTSKSRDMLSSTSSLTKGFSNLVKGPKEGLDSLTESLQKKVEGVVTSGENLVKDLEASGKKKIEDLSSSTKHILDDKAESFSKEILQGLHHSVPVDSKGIAPTSLQRKGKGQIHVHSYLGQLELLSQETVSDRKFTFQKRNASFSWSKSMQYFLLEDEDVLLKFDLRGAGLRLKLCHSLDDGVYELLIDFLIGGSIEFTKNGHVMTFTENYKKGLRYNPKGWTSFTLSIAKYQLALLQAAEKDKTVKCKLHSEICPILGIGQRTDGDYEMIFFPKRKSKREVDSKESGIQLLV